MERPELSESEQRLESSPSKSSDSTLSGAVDSKGTVATGPISGPETSTEERAGSAINNQHPECTSPSLSLQGPEKAVEFKEVAQRNKTSETNGEQKDLSSDIPTTPAIPLGEQKNPVVNRDLNGGNTASDTLVAAAETVRGPAVLEVRSEFPNVPEEGNTYSDGRETTSRELSERKRNASESASRETMISTEPQQKAPETRDPLGSSSKMKDGQKRAQVSNIP